MPRHWRLGEAAEATVPGDADRLVVALDALLENAVAHTEPGDRIEVSVPREGTTAVIAVADSGCGIPPEDLDHILADSPGPSPTSAARRAGSASGCPSCRPSPRPTTVRSGSTAPAARARPSRWSSPPSASPG